MPRSQCENENVQFVQELAEVDGPFESPININYRDLTKLELPSLCWNRSEACPQKMKITNTGHTVIISGKWKCERPYLTGGPLVGKYVFSQIHFHWGQDDCKGSEHQVCGEGFPLEMHVAHFKTDYLSQENALKEKDGMVVVVYLFKLQNEPNPAFKKILSLLPCVQQPCTSRAFEPRPLMSLINPFTDDYFVYWGSVITPTCAHILLWMICREPFGISREQVEEFRKIMDSSQHPICRNSREVQPLHKRNVFHVNASRELDNPLLPVKQMLGCYCKGSEENISLKSAQLEASSERDCSCPAYFRNQEEIEGTAPYNKKENLCRGPKGTVKWDSSLSGSAYLKQYVYVQNAIVTPTPLLAKKIESEMIKKIHHPVRKLTKSEVNVRTNFVSPSCCFFPMEKINQIKPRPDRRKNREKKKSSSFRTFSSILNSLEALKNHTFKKLKKIDAINQEIKGMKSFCQNAEDKRWLRNIETIMTKQKRFTVKKSQNCFDELKKLARECNFDKLFDNKQFPMSRNYQNLIQMENQNGSANPALPCPDPYDKKADVENNLKINQVTIFALKAQKLIQSFFEDIKDTEDLQKNLMLKKVESIYKKEAGDSNLIQKGYITQKMFTMGNLGDRFFREVTTEVDTEEEKVEEVIITMDESLDNQEKAKFERKCEIRKVASSKIHSVIPLHKATKLSKLNKFSKSSDDLENYFPVGENQVPNFGSLSDAGTTSDDENFIKNRAEKKFKKKNTTKKPLENYLKRLNELTEEKFKIELKTDETLANMWYSNSTNFLSDSTEAQKMFNGKFRKTKSKRDPWKRKSSFIAKISAKKVFDKSHRKSKGKNVSFEGYYLKKKKRSKNTTLRSSCSLSSTSRETMVNTNKSKWKRLVKAHLKLAITKSVNGSSESEMEYRNVSPKRKKLKLDIKKINATPTEKLYPAKNRETLTDDDAKTTTNAENQKKAVCEITNESERTPELVVLAEKLLEKYREAVTQTATSKVELKSSRDQQHDSKNKIFRTTSEEYRNDLEKSKPGNSFQEDLAKTTEAIQKTQIKKILVKNKSLTSLTNSPRFFSSKTRVRLFMENIGSRRKCFKDHPGLKKTGIPRVIENPKMLREPQKEPDEKLDTDIICGLEKIIPETKQDTPGIECNVDIFRTSVKQDEKLRPPQIQREKSKIPLVKRCYGQRHGFLRRKRREIDSWKHQSIEEMPEDRQPTELKKSLKNDKGKNDDDNVQNDELQTSVFLTRIKKNSASRSFSAESLNSLSRPLKRANKKRPHISKRSSKHYIRKNSLYIRKPNKVESKPLHRTGVRDEEQLKSISHDVARYLRQTLIGRKHPLRTGTNTVKGIEEIMIKNLKATEEKEMPVKEESAVKKKQATQDIQAAPRVVKKPEQKIPRLKQKIKSIPSEIPKEKPSSPKPTHDFIKRNKLMAGKYKRKPSLAEKRTEVKPIAAKAKLMNNTNGKVLQKEYKDTPVLRSQPNSTKPETLAGNVERRTKIPKSLRKFEKARERPKGKLFNCGNEQQSEKLNCPATQVAVQKMPPPNTRFLPAYMMTSYLPPPIEIVQNQQNKMNRYLLNTDVEISGPDVLKDNPKKEKTCQFLYKRDLEYLLTLQRCLRGEVSTGVEKSMNFVKTLLNQEHYGATVLADSSANEPFDCYEPLHYSDSRNSGIVLIEMNDFLDSSTSNSDLSGYFKLKPMDGLNKQLKNKIYISKVPQDSGDPGIINPIINHNNQEEWNSDSNYDCQIFITLRTNSNEVEGDTPPQSMTEDISSGTQEMTNRSFTFLERSSSQSFTLKQHRKKRKENEISAEMKRKLLEILETEIQREMGIEYSISTETGSEGHATYNLEDSEGNQRSQSTGSLDNVEVFEQISETMRQYLSGFKESADETE